MTAAVHLKLSPEDRNDQLSYIKGKRFTRREIDIIACLLCGRASTIPSFLSIAARTVETHIHNIMLKIGCNSRERIIDFIESSDKLPSIKAHYQHLVIEVSFQKHLKNIRELLYKKSVTVSIVYHPTKHKSFMPAIHEIVKHLKLIGCHILFHDQPQTINTIALTNENANIHKIIHVLKHSDCLENNNNLITNIELIPHTVPILFDHKAVHNDVLPINVFNFNTFDNYHVMFFELIKKIMPAISFDLPVASFNEHVKAISSGVLPFEVVLEKQAEPTHRTVKKRTLLNKINFLLFNRSIYRYSIYVFFMLLFISVIAIYKAVNEEEFLLQGSTFRSDLLTPNEKNLLLRPELIFSINEKLSPKHNSSPIKIVGIVGIGGAGKTTIARYYAKSRKEKIIWEINAETHDSLMSSFKDLAHILAQTKAQKEEVLFIQKLANADEREKLLVSFVRKNLMKQSNWLLIYDNVNAFSDIRDFFPQDVALWGRGKVIVTTRDYNITHSSYIAPDCIVHVDELTPSQALALFYKTFSSNAELSQLTEENTQKTVDFLDHIPPFPLDISMAAFYIKNLGCTYGYYLKRMKENDVNFEHTQKEFLKEETHYTKTRYAIVKLSLQRIINENPEFKELLFLISLLSSQDISKKIIEHCKDTVLTDQFIHVLKKYSFINIKTNVNNNTITTLFSLHRSTQKISQHILLRLLSTEEKEAFIKKFTFAFKSFYDLNIDQNYASLLILLPHVKEFLKNINKISFKDDLKEKAQQNLLMLLGSIYMTCDRNLVLEKDYFTKVIDLQDRTKQLSDYTLAAMSKNLAEACSDMSDTEGAIHYANKSIEFCHDTPDLALLVAENYRIIGFAHTLQNDFDQSYRYYMKGLDSISHLDPAIRKDTESNIYAILAWLYSVTHINGVKADPAKTYIKKALDLVSGTHSFFDIPISTKIKTQEKISCTIARHKVCLGDIYCRFGDYRAAYESGFREAQYIIDNALDSCAHRLSRLYIKIGMGEIHLREGRLEKAKETFLDAIATASRITAPGDPVTLSSYIFCAETRIRLGEFENAYKDYLASLHIMKNIDTNYFRLMWTTGHYHAAIIKYKQGDLQKSIEHFSDFFNHIKGVCKAILTDEKYNELTAQNSFECMPYYVETINKDMSTLLNRSAAVFLAIYGESHPFVRDYVLKNG